MTNADSLICRALALTVGPASCEEAGTINARTSRGSHIVRLFIGREDSIRGDGPGSGQSRHSLPDTLLQRLVSIDHRLLIPNGLEAGLHVEVEIESSVACRM